MLEKSKNQDALLKKLQEEKLEQRLQMEKMNSGICFKDYD
jgi:hypothetical protein